MKIKMIEVEKFLKTLSDDWCIEDGGILDEYYREDGKLINPEAIVDIKKDEISICWQGGAEKPIRDQIKDFLHEFKIWKKVNNYTYIVLEIDKSRLDEVTEILKTNNIKVVR